MLHPYPLADWFFSKLFAPNFYLFIFIELKKAIFRFFYRPTIILFPTKLFTKVIDNPNDIFSQL